MDDLQRETKDHCKALLQSHLFYIRTGVAPTEYNQSKIRDQIDGRIDAIPNRLAAFVEDLQALHDSEVYTEDDWPDLWASLSDPEPRNAAYTDLFGPTSDVDKQAYQTGLQLGHLARLLIQFSGQPIDKQRKDRDAALAAFTLGIKGYGLTSADSQHSEVQDDILHHDDLGGDKLFDIHQLDDGLESIGDFGTRIENGLVDDLPRFSEAAKDVIADAGLPPTPPVVNAVYNEFNNQQTGDAGDEFEVAINTIQQDYEIDRIEQMCNCLEEDIPQLMKQSSNMGPDITEAEVLYATCMSSESGSDIDVVRHIRDIAEDNRSGNADTLTEEVIKSTLANLKGEALGPNHWEDTPIISSDNTPNAYGRLLAQIIFDDDRIRTTDEYLPTTINDETAAHGGTGTSIHDIIIQPTSADIRKACYAIGLDGPSIGSIDGSWATLFDDAYRIRVNKN